MTVLAALALVWVALLLLTPWLPVPLAGVVYVLGGRICHQIAERSFFLDGAQLPVCARCLGIYVGAAVGLLSSLPGPQFMARRALRNPAFAPTRSDVGWVARSGPATWLVGAGALNVVTLWSASNSVRAAVGLVLGLALALAIGTVDYGRWRRPLRSRSAPPQLPL